MRRAVLIVIALSGAARAEPWRVAGSVVSRFDPDGDGGLGVAVGAVQDRADRAFGAVLEHTWLFPQHQERGIRQLDALGLIRWGRPFAMEVAAGLAIYHGRVDLPGSCVGCGMYSGTTPALLVRAGVVWTYPLRRELALELGARLVLTRAPAGDDDDSHYFAPPPVALQSGVGVSSTF
jgi:hypothetical protein